MPRLSYRRTGWRRRKKRRGNRTSKRFLRLAKKAAIGAAQVHWCNIKSDLDGTTDVPYDFTVPQLGNSVCSRIRGIATNKGWLMPLWDANSNITKDDSVHSWEGNELYLLGFKYNFFFRPDGTAVNRQTPVRFMWGWYKSSSNTEVPASTDFISENLSLPKTILPGATNSDGVTSLIQGQDSRAAVYFPWTLTSQDPLLSHRSNYKILGSKVLSVSHGETTSDFSLGTQEVMMPFYFKVNRKMTFETSSTEGIKQTAWTPFIFMYASNDDATAKVQCTWEGRMYWKNMN